jgi:hypothetical protein
VKMAVFWDVAPCSLTDIDRRFREVYCFYHQDDETWDSPALTINNSAFCTYGFRMILTVNKDYFLKQV